MNNLFIKQVRHEISKSSLRRPLVWLHHKYLSQENIFIASYPRSGSTWLRFMLKEILTGEDAKFDNINRFIPYVGRHYHAPSLLLGGSCLIKTHETYRNEYKKAIYLVRDVRDVLNSEYSYQKWRGVYRKSLNTFLRSFLYGSVNGYGSWQKHVNSWLDASLNKSNDILVIRYEELCFDTEGVLERVLGFLGSVPQKSTIQRVVHNNTVEQMRKKEKEVHHTIHKNYRRDISFIRNGTPGNWHKELNFEQIKLLEKHANHALLRLGYLELNWTLNESNYIDQNFPKPRMNMRRMQY